MEGTIHSGGWIEKIEPGNLFGAFEPIEIPGGRFREVFMMRSGEHGDAFFKSRHPDAGDSASPSWKAIARFLNVAEAGYFAHELKLLGNIPVSLQAEEDFDAVSGHWSAGFVLRVPEPWAERAAVTLQELVRQTEAEDPLPELSASPLEGDGFLEADSRPFDPFAEEPRFRDRDPVNWVPIVVTLAAGSMAIWGFKKLWEPARPQPAAAPAKAPRDVLWDVMRTPAGTHATLREDSDGDQLFDRTLKVERR